MNAENLRRVADGDDGRHAYLTPDERTAFAADRAEREARGRAVMDAILDDIRTRGRRSAFAMVKSRARVYQRRPIEIAAIPGLAAWSTPEAIIAVAEHHLEVEPARRRMGFGGEVPLVNLRAARLYGRWLRRVYAAAARETERAVA